jgi:hypothetical protein
VRACLLLHEIIFGTLRSPGEKKALRRCHCDMPWKSMILLCLCIGFLPQALGASVNPVYVPRITHTSGFHAQLPGQKTNEIAM